MTREEIDRAGQSFDWGTKGPTDFALEMVRRFADELCQKPGLRSYDIAKLIREAKP